MAREIGKLSAMKVTKASEPGLYADGGGLYLRIGPTGAKSWVYRFMIAGKRRDMGLGPLHTITLAEARAKAVECRKQKLDGNDPLAAREAVRAAQRAAAMSGMTFKECATAYIDAHKAGWRNPKHRQQWGNTLETYAYPVFGSLPVQAVDLSLVIKAVEPIWATKPETASRLRGRIEAVLDWATVRQFRAGDNPARWRGHLDSLLPSKAKVRAVEHHPALPYGEIASFMTALRQQEGVSARALEFVILTAARTGEAIGARWDEIDFEAKVWTVPGARMKAGREHRVPLSARAVTILDGMQAVRAGDYVFPGAKAGAPLSGMALLMTLRRMGRDDLTAHGFRSTFRDWAAERTAFPAEVAEMALAHTLSDKVEAAYRRGDLFEKRRALADAWAKFCATPQGSGRVVSLNRTAQAK